MKQKIVDLLKGKEIYFIYLFSYLTFIFLNNILHKVYGLVFFQKINFHFFWWAEWCRNGKWEFDAVIKHFFAFQFLKLALVLLVFLYYKRKTNSTFRKFIFEVCISFLLFDVLYILLTPIGYFEHFDLNWYYGSQLDQLLINKAENFPEYIVSLFWLMVLIVFALTTRYRNLKLKYWIYRLGGVLISFLWGCIAIDILI